MKLNFSVGKPKTSISERDRQIIESSATIAERKWDGSRMVGVIGEKVTLLSRALSTVSGDFIEYTEKFPHIISELKSLHLPSSTILDGEVVCLDRDDSTVEDFDAIKGILNSKDERARELQAKSSKAHWMIWDILQVGGSSFTHRTYRERRKWLESVISPYLKYIHLVEQIRFKTLKELEWQLPLTNWEGYVIKLLDSEYETHSDPSKTKRMSGWWKLRLDREIDLVVTGFDYGQGKFEEVVGSLRCGIFNDNGCYLHVCNVGGLTDKQRREMLSLDYPRVACIKYTQKIASKVGKKVKYVEGGREHIVNVAPFSLRFPVFQRFHIDKRVEECVL